MWNGVTIAPKLNEPLYHDVLLGETEQNSVYDEQSNNCVLTTSSDNWWSTVVIISYPSVMYTVMAADKRCLFYSAVVAVGGNFMGNSIALLYVCPYYKICCTNTSLNVQAASDMT